MPTTTNSELAINGGPKAKATPFGTGKRFAGNELKYLTEALESNTLFYGFGTQVKAACAMMAKYTGVPHIVPCSSGSAAIHLGLIACGIGPGDEVITTPNTDSGTVLGIIEEGAVPVFCDPEMNLQPSARAIKACITKHTKAVVVVHLAGYPAPMGEIMELCNARGIGVVEDCAQSWGARINGKLVGSFGTAGAYSTNDWKHISTGDGGFVALQDHEHYRRVSNYSDKHYDRLFDNKRRQAHHGINYRMSELQGAVARAQLERVDDIAKRHNHIGTTLAEALKPLRGATMVKPIEGGYSTYWWTVLLIDESQLTATRNELVEALQAEGVPASSHQTYDLIGKPLFQTRNVRPWLDDARRTYPFDQPDGRSYHYSLDNMPRHRQMLDTGITLGISTWYTDTDVAEIAAGVLKVFDAFVK